MGTKATEGKQRYSPISGSLSGTYLVSQWLSSFLDWDPLYRMAIMLGLEMSLTWE